MISSTLINVVGFCAAALTTFSFLPQFIKIIKIKKTQGLSLLMMIQIEIGLVLWIIYGLLRKDIVLISANSVGFLIVLATLIAYFKYSRMGE